MGKRKITIHDMAIVGLFAAMIFVATMFLGIKIYTPTGTTMLKTANAICLLGGLLFGGVRGGLAAGFGSMLFDLTYPEYVLESPITFIRFFLTVFICGTIAHWGGNKAPSNIRIFLAATCGGIFDSCFYIGKSIMILMMEGSAFVPAVIASSPKIAANLVNVVFAIGVSTLLAVVLYPRLTKAGLIKKFE